MKRTFLFLAGVLSAAIACGGDARTRDAEKTGQSAEALAAGATIPEPLATPTAATSAWDGTLVDLMAMDTWATCGLMKVNGVLQPIDYQLAAPSGQQSSTAGDIYLARLLVRAGQMMANRVNANPPAPSVLQAWMDYRDDPAYNRNSSTHLPQGAGLKPIELAAYALDFSDPSVNPAQRLATQSVALAAMNACIAQGARTLSLGGNTLVMSEAEQMQSLELVRERAQIALLQYAAIFNALASPGPAFTGSSANPATQYQAMAYLQAWGAALSPLGAAALGKWVTDFSAMVQLHLEATSELTDMFRRSAAAKSPRGGAATVAADEIWGAGSWRQRLLALLYGGDPLAADASTPWTNMANRGVPGVPLDTSIRAAEPWPTRAELPFFLTDAGEPHVQQFLTLAQQKDVLTLLQNPGGPLDIPSSAEQIYRSLEAKLRTEQCTTVTSGACQQYAMSDIPPWTGPGGSTPAETYQLSSVFGITPAHAATATKLLAEFVSGSGTPAVRLVGQLSTDQQAAYALLHIPRDAAMVPRSLIEVEPIFERYSPYRIPATVDPNVERTHYETPSASASYRTGDDQGVSAGGIYAESMRTFGAVPALSLARDVIRRVLASTTAPAALKTPLTTVSAPLLASISEGAGAYATRVAPIESSVVYNWGQFIAGGRSVTEKLQTIQVQRSPKVVVTEGWAVDVDVDSTNPFFQPGAGVQFSVVAIPNDSTAYTLALSPAARRFDGTAISDLATGVGSLSAPAILQNGVLHAELYVLAVALSQATPPPTWTLVATRSQSSGVTYVPLTGAVPLYSWQFNRAAVGSRESTPLLSYQFAAGGQFGRAAYQAWAVQRSDPAQPAMDGFGLPYTWVPSADATAFGSQAGDSVMTYFLRNAESAAQQATQAVQAAITSSLQAAQATLDQQASQARSDLVLQQQAQTVCGAAANTPACVFDAQPTDLPFITWTSMPDAWQGIPTDPESYCKLFIDNDTDPLRRLDCMAYDKISAASRGLPLAAPVVPVADSTTAQTFDAFSGGQLQGELVSQWAAVRRLADVAQKLETSKKGAAARVQSSNHTVDQLQQLVNAAQKQLDGLNDEQKATQALLARTGQAAALQCTAVLDYLRSIHMTMHNGPTLNGCKQTGTCLGSSDADQLVQNVEDFTGEGWMANPANWSQLRGLEAACLQARTNFDEAQQKAVQDGVMVLVQQFDVTAAQDAVEAAKGTTISAMMDGIESIQSAAAEMDSAIADLAKSVAAIANIRQQARLAVARQQLESAIGAQGAALSIGMLRQYNQYDWWRARALLDGARRYGVAAMRAIETQYVAKLDTMMSPEPFVAAPASWANDVYKYDLSMPSAVGLSVGAPVSGAQYPNQVLDYVGNLQRFVQGFAVERPMTAAVDNDIVTMPGPGAVVVVDGQVIPHPGRSMWSVLCPAGTACTSPTAPGWCPLQATTVANVCAVPPTVPTGTTTYLPPSRIRAPVLLDPWGRRMADTYLTQYQARINARWGRFAVNLVGNGVRDCSRARDPNTCQASQFLPYDLQHAGPALAIGATRQWRLLDIPVAQVESGKAATLGEFLDVEQNGWGKPFVEAIARVEFGGRPLSGTYILDLAGDGSTNFDAIESVQILLSSSYAVMQH